LERLYFDYDLTKGETHREISWQKKYHVVIIVYDQELSRVYACINWLLCIFRRIFCNYADNFSGISLSVIRMQVASRQHNPAETLSVLIYTIYFINCS
jgi:hypothetical protein